MAEWTGWFFRQEVGEPPTTVARWQWPDATLCEIWKEPGEWVPEKIYMALLEEPCWVGCTKEEAEDWLQNESEFPPKE